MNGNILFVSDSVAPFDLGTVAIYKCYPGYVLIGEYKVRNCLANHNLDIGYWNGTAPSCERESSRIVLSISLQVNFEVILNMSNTVNN